VQSTVNDFNKVEILNEKAWSSRYSYPTTTIEYAIEAREISAEIDYKHGLAFSYLNTGAARNFLAQYQFGLEDLQRAYLLFKQLDDTYYLSITLRNIGNIYFSLNQFDSALQNYERSMHLAISIDDQQSIAYLYNHIGRLKQKQGLFDDALQLHLKALKILNTVSDDLGIAGTYTNIGETHFNMAQYEDAEHELLRSLEMCSKLGHIRGVALVCNVLASLYSVLQQDVNCIEHHQMALAAAHEIRDKLLQVQFYQNLASSYRKMGLHDKAFECIEFYDKLKTQVMDQNFEITLKSQQVEFQLKQTEIENIRFKQKNEELEKVNKLIRQQHKDITDSIRYAKHIQEAILTRPSYINEFLDQWFIFYQSRDIVSGDFYWLRKKNGLIYIATVDCTGHGVPGAFISIVGSNLLNQILHEHNYTNTDLFMNEMNLKFNETIRQTLHESTVKDGMDMSLCIIDTKNKIVEFSGANTKIFIKQDDELICVKGDKHPIGIFIGEELKPFQSHKVPYRDGDVLYMFSDGIVDQFGGPDNKKLLVRRFSEFLLANVDEPLPNQGQLLNNYFNSWKGDNEQVDDVMVVGVKLS
jgi:serine phosphatase RsbU (regulator of sigma subunit)/Tfp pilus assembly protein PilF